MQKFCAALIPFSIAVLALRPLAAQDTNVSSNSNLAEKILNDKSLTTVHEKAKRLLTGQLNAGSGYGEVWIRDFNTFIEVALEVNDSSHIRDALLTFFKFQGPQGDIVDGYIPKQAANAGYDYRSSPLAPDLEAHKNTVEVDQESSLVQAVAKYVLVTKDRSILDEQIGGEKVMQRLSDALNYLMKQRFDKDHGLIWGATRADWGDVQPETPWGVVFDSHSHRAFCVYDNAMFILAIQEYLKLAELSTPDIDDWKSTLAGLKSSVRQYLWDANRQKFIPHVYLDGSPFPADFDENQIYYFGGTAVAIEAGLLSPQEVRSSLKTMDQDVRAAHASSIGLTLYPPYPAGFFKNGLAPYYYQNGGDWCWFGGRMVQQLIRYGMVDDAYRELMPMVDRVQRTGDFHEWWTPDNQPRGSGAFRGSAGVLGKAIEMLQDWARRSSSSDPQSGLNLSQ